MSGLRIKLSPCFIILMGLTAMMAHGFAADAQVLRVRADSWMPFNGDPVAEKPGYVVEFLREIFEPQGIKVDYQVMPWADALKAAAAGEVDGVIGANATEAENLVIGKEPIAEPQFSLFVRKDSTWKYQNLRSLQSVHLGAVEGYSYWESIDGYIKKNAGSRAVKFYSGNAPATEAVADLSAGKIDVFVESVLVFYWALKGSGQKFSDYRTAYTEPTEPLFVAFTKNKQGTDFAQKMDAGLARLKASGRYQAILDSYGFAKK
jgi:polar amino acid transport system substrate-binding protein